MFVCGAATLPAVVGRALVSLASCCEDALLGGAPFCTCWEPEFDFEQTRPDPTIEPKTRVKACDDCAFRAGSPEKTGDERYTHTGAVNRLPHFWCHQGMRKPVRWRHPAGLTVEADVDGYMPPKVHVGGIAVPFKADGTPGDRCAGHAAQVAP